MNKQMKEQMDTRVNERTSKRTNGQDNEEIHKETMRLTDGNKEERIAPIAIHQWHTERVDMMKCKQVLGEFRLMKAAVPNTACPSYPTSSHPSH